MAGVQERDKWRRRLEVLETSLAELVERRQRLEAKLRKVRDELQNLEKTAREFVDLGPNRSYREVAGVAHGPILR